MIDENFISLRGSVLLHQIVGMALLLMMLLVLNRKATIPAVLRYYESGHCTAVNDVDRNIYCSVPIENVFKKNTNAEESDADEKTFVRKNEF